ncbi:STE11-like protein [Mycena venus]|uniref:mitogen-activated protein kinase kinase kinase n=1 Tax=Mycena venus TaxID=2733690 RepID=A0A8H6XCX3_9AGAR|nr:STE11-like protein [Mycena venus]
MAMTANTFRDFDSPPSPVSPNSSFVPRSFVSAIRAYADFIRTWTDAHVARWLTDIKCASHAPAFRANDIRGDILLELDQTTLMEMGVSSIGDRLRIINAVKALRQRSAARSPATPVIENMRLPRLDVSPDVTAIKQDRIEASPATRLGHRRLESGRPAPLQLNQSSGRNDLPRLVREGNPPDSARSTHSSNNSNNNNSSATTSMHTVRPLPQPSQLSRDQSNSSQNANPRANLPPLPPPPQSRPPLPPPTRQTARGMTNGSSQLAGRRTPTPDSYSSPSQPLPPAPPQQSGGGLLTPSSGSSWSGLPSNPRPGNPGPNERGAPARSTSPLLPGRNGPPRTSSHGRGTSLGSASPGPSSSPSSRLPTRANTRDHPYSNPQSSALQAPITGLANNLSPIEEGFNHSLSPRGPNPGTPSLDDLRRKLVRFLLPEEGLSFTVDIGSCVGGIEVLEKVLKKFGKGASRSPGDGGPDVRETPKGGISVDGWGVYLDVEQEDGPGEPLSEAELLSVCHAPPNHPVREHGLTLRRTFIGARRSGSEGGGGSASPSRGKFLGVGSSSGTTSKAAKRASAISILSGLGVDDPERALLLDPPSPTRDSASPTPSGPPTPPLTTGGKKRPGKLHNFFGQRPPSELITDHLTQYFPMTDKKVLARTARQSMLFRSNTRSKRDSAASWNSTAPPPPPLPGSSQSRFSTSTQGSARTSFSSHIGQPPPPPLPEDGAVPRVSLSTEDGRSMDLHSSDGSAGSPPKLTTHPQLLPPIPFPTESFSESLGDAIAGPAGGARVSRSLSAASRRMSYMTEVRSKRDRTDTASMLTVDEITADLATDRSKDEDEWTKVESQDGLEESAESTLGGDAEDDLEDDDDDELEDADEEGTLNDPDDDDDESSKGEQRTATKWIKGALIGAGSFGKVYLGMDASTGLLMAVKQVELPTGSAPNQERKKSMLSALEREIELLKDLQHENIVQYLYSSLDDDYLNIFLEYVPGGSVTALLRNYGAFEEPLVKNFVRQILEGLNYLHERDIIHRDIKGANILVDNKGGIKISDFGISKKVEDGMGAGNRMHRPSLQGSVFWMAPEVVKQSGHTRKADIWSVGCLVVEMLTGEHPWATLTQMQAIFKIGSSAKPAIPSDISNDAQDFLLRTFELDQEARPSAAELLQHPWVCKKPVAGKKGQAPTTMVEVSA